MNKTVANDAIMTVLKLILLRMYQMTVNKCNARNPYPANHKTSVTETSICSSIPRAK